MSSAQDQPSSDCSVVAHRSTGGSDVAFHTRHGDKYHGRKKEEGCKEGWKEKGCEEEVSSLPPTKKAGAPRRLFLLLVCSRAALQRLVAHWFCLTSRRLAPHISKQSWWRLYRRAARNDDTNRFLARQLRSFKHVHCLTPMMRAAQTPWHACSLVSRPTSAARERSASEPSASCDMIRRSAREAPLAGPVPTARARETYAPGGVSRAVYLIVDRARGNSTHPRATHRVATRRVCARERPGLSCDQGRPMSPNHGTAS